MKEEECQGLKIGTHHRLPSTGTSGTPCLLRSRPPTEKGWKGPGTLEEGWSPVVSRVLPTQTRVFNPRTLRDLLYILRVYLFFGVQRSHKTNPESRTEPRAPGMKIVVMSVRHEKSPLPTNPQTRQINHRKNQSEEGRGLRV